MSVNSGVDMGGSVHALTTRSGSPRRSASKAAASTRRPLGSAPSMPTTTPRREPGDVCGTTTTGTLAPATTLTPTAEVVSRSYASLR
ncbi:hypothetical protein DVJ78_13465 [Humibacter sp. BT305]|nr:hypothetical protein DVJ78_13465 [Humibacter sp. BT305]